MDDQERTMKSMVTQQITTRAARPAGAPRWSALRAQMPAAKQWAYFDHAAVAPLSGPARSAIQLWSRDAADNGDVHWPEWSRRIEQVRRQSAALLGAQLDEIALVPNTTAGINLVAEGFPWQAGDNVVTFSDEFPSNRIPWQNLAARGVECRLVEPTGTAADLDRLLAACDTRTRIVSVSWVGYASGRRWDPARLAEAVHSRGALLFLDAIQGLGVFPLDVSTAGVDFLAADGHKWLLGPEGAGIAYVRRDHLDKLRPIGLGWNSVADEHDFSRPTWRVKPSAARYEGGTMNTGGFIGLGASLALLAGYDTTAIAERVINYTERLCEGLRKLDAVVVSDRSPSAASGIVLFEMPGRSPSMVRRSLLEAGVVVSVRTGKLRVSPHAYNNDADLDRFFDALLETT
ncbi:MAG: aminotransferase class V-fold PLP-dependent enzyme [Planctomycetaceae bacterium]|nr:aminotransferase class V-fold PLP-dependent enzyme [Planctomycetaceae bacterium]